MLLILERYFSQWTEIGMFLVLQLTSSRIVTHLFTFTLYSLILQETNSVSREPVKITKLDVCSEEAGSSNQSLIIKGLQIDTGQALQVFFSGALLCWKSDSLYSRAVVLQWPTTTSYLVFGLTFWRQPSVSSKTSQGTADNKVCLCSYQTSDGEHVLCQIWLLLTNCVPRRWWLRPSQVILSTCTANLLEKQGSWTLAVAWTWDYPQSCAWYSGLPYWWGLQR